MRQSDSERRLRTIFDDAFRFSALLSPDGEVLEIERQALEFWGLNDEQVRGRHFWDIGWRTVPDDHSGRLRAVVEAAAQGRAVRQEAAVWDTARQATPIVFSLRPLRDRAGRVVLLVAEVRNLNPRRQVEQRLQSSGDEQARRRRDSAALHSLLECLQEAVWVITESAVTDANAAALSICGAASMDELNDDPRALLEGLQPRAIDSGQPLRLEECPMLRALQGEAAVAEMLIHDWGVGADRLVRCVAAPAPVAGEAEASAVVVLERRD